MEIDRHLQKYALVHMGNDESYGLLFVATELSKRGFSIKWFDGDCKDAVDKIAAWDPDFALFSPLTVFFPQSLCLSKNIKSRVGKVRCVFGGHHVSAVPECLELDGVDAVVVGPVYGTIDKISAGSGKQRIHGVPASPDEMIPSRRGYYEAIPRISRIRKTLMSHFGCVYNCSYCSTSRLRRYYGVEEYRRFWLKRRSPGRLIEEAKLFLEYPGKEVELADDDVLMGNDAGEWLTEFSELWKKEINLPIYGYVSPLTALRASDATLRTLSGLMTCVTMGVQSAREESLKLFNRAFQSEEMLKKAYDRLSFFGIQTRLDVIIGLPVKDPVGDAIDTIKLAQRIAPGTCVICYPLMVYPGTDLYEWCVKNHVAFNEECSMEWHTGIGSIKFDDETNRKLKNIKKLTTMFVRCNVSERWMRALMEMEMTEASSRKLSECQYYDSLRFRLGEEAVADFDKILSGIDLKY